MKQMLIAFFFILSSHVGNAQSSANEREMASRLARLNEAVQMPNRTFKAGKSHWLDGKMTLVSQKITPTEAEWVLRKGKTEVRTVYRNLRWDLYTRANGKPVEGKYGDGDLYELNFYFEGSNAIQRVQTVSDGKSVETEIDSVGAIEVFYQPNKFSDDELISLSTFFKEQARNLNRIRTISNDAISAKFKSSSKPSVVAFWYNGCGPCLVRLRTMYPYYLRLQNHVSFSFVSVLTNDTSLLVKWPRTFSTIRELFTRDSIYYNPAVFSRMTSSEWDVDFLKTLSTAWDGSFVPMIFLVKGTTVLPIGPNDDISEKMKTFFRKELEQ